MMIQAFEVKILLLNNNLPVGGPHYLVTPTILDILKEKKVKATFFITGSNMQYNSNFTIAW